MKVLLFVLSIFLVTIVKGTTYYISPSGNDATGTGTSTNPWKTLYKATNTAIAAGDIIHVNPGTYVETTQCLLRAGVNIIGEGLTSIIKSTLTSDFTPIILAASGIEGTDGNQSISYLKFDGQNRLTSVAISVYARKNVSIHHCYFIDFNFLGVAFVGKTSLFPNNVAPGTYALDNSFHHNTVINCAHAASGTYGKAALWITGQQDMHVHNNYMNQTQRAARDNGWLIKATDFNKGLKIYNDTLIKAPYPYATGGSDDYWDFAIEMGDEEGLEIYNCIITGSIDMNRQVKGSYPYSVYIHDNIIGPATLGTGFETGIIFEYGTQTAIVENNIFKNITEIITFSTRSLSAVTDITVRKNLAYNIGQLGHAGNGSVIHFISDGSNNYTVNNFSAYNNTFVGNAILRPLYGASFSNAGSINNLNVNNNIFMNFGASAVGANNGGVVSNCNISHNDFYLNGTNIGWNTGTPTNYTNTPNLTTNPLFVSASSDNYALQPASPLIDAGFTILGLLFSGAAPDIGYAEFGTVLNLPPVANAGINQSVSLPIALVNLSGSGTDPDGTVVSYAWTQVAGPAPAIILNPLIPIAIVTSLIPGTYKFELKVTDNNGATGKDTTDIIVTSLLPGNNPPAANAGVDQTITLPANTINLTGSGTDPDGTITAYLWTKIAGPAATITNPNVAATSVTGLVAGTYRFELKVTDNDGATGTDTVQVIVNPAANVAPTANAGPDQLITLPLNTINLAGSGTDPDGTITAYLWTKIAGPAGAGTITNPNSAATSVTGLVAGTYRFRLRVTDNNGAFGRDTIEVIVNPAPPPPGNIAPTANAGADQNITLPLNTVNLFGSGTDPDGAITAYQWTKIAGPTAGTITTANAAATSVTGLTAGTYRFELRVTDNNGATGTDTMQVVVNPAANVPPTANAGADQNITLPLNTINLSGSGIDTDGSITAYQWTKIAGPAAGVITNANAAATSVTGLTAGTYRFELRVTDNNGAFGKDTIQVIVNPAAVNLPPTANAGADQNITLPLNTVNLAGSGTDPDGTITAYLWTKIAGPAAGTITTANAATTSVTGLTAGTYSFELTVTDNSGATATDIVQVVVNPAANVAPTANAGADQNITLPLNTVNLSGSGTDTDGTITAYLWTKIAGPAATITSPNAAATSVTGLVAGTYRFELSVTDNNGATDTDTMQVIVNAAANVPPTANAGADQNITLPLNTINLSGSGIDTDGSITAYQWTKIAGPAAGVITNANAAATSVTGLTAGTYRFELTVTDNSGATAADIVQVVVNPVPNIAPTANAGIDQFITLPVNAVNLSGSGIDPDGTISAYHWTKIAGPAAGVITNANAAATSVTGLVGGVYKFMLQVTDNSGATDTDTMQVVVFVPNIAPTANAGLNQSITLPTNTSTLSGSGNDIDGTIVSYTWTKLSGPAGGTISNANSASTAVTSLTAGIYLYELRVTDNNGATGRDTIQITVNAANIPPVANAGPDQSIVLPTHSATLTGSGTDVDGTVAGYDWRQISGPVDKLVSLHTPVTVLDNLIAGTYIFELTVTDNKGAIDKDTVKVISTEAVIPGENAIKVYPNPVIDIITLDISRVTNTSALLIKITDMQGKNVYMKQLAAGNYSIKEQINMSSFAKGTYMITVFFKSLEKKTIKVVKL